MIWVKVVFIYILMGSGQVFACVPSDDYKPPTLEENVKRAEKIFLGRIVGRDANLAKGGHGSVLDISVEKVWKGSPSHKMKLITDENDCSELYGAHEGSRCVFLVAKEDVLMNGLAGDSSFCFRINDSDAKTMATEFETKIRKFR